ncbi:MAG: hypothetical protein K6E15_05050 [Prevotella sp.]|nr:hypothetical protein [Prevotella sp.]
MNLIYEFILKFDVNNLLYAISGKQLDEEEIVSLTNDISDYHVKLKRQKQNLFKFCKTFPKEFASEDNHLVDSSVKISRRMRSGAACVKRVFKRFCKVSQKQLPEGVPDHQAHEVSLITTSNYILDLYGLSSFPQSVKELFKVMFEFYQDLSECLEEGLRTIEKVEATKHNAPECLKILKEACEKSKKNQRVLIEAMMTDPEMKKAVMNNKTFSGDDENPVLKEYKNTPITEDESVQKFAQKYYKNCSPKDVDKIAIYKVSTDMDNENPYQSFAKVVFGNDESKIRRINCVIEHFDELLPEKCKRDKIPALYLYFFYVWSNPIVGIETFLKYFNNYYLEHNGRWKTIGKSAITGACSKHTLCKDDSTQKVNDKMMSQIDTILSLKSPKMELVS